MQYRSELGAQTTPHSDLYCKESLYYFDYLQKKMPHALRATLFIEYIDFAPYT